MGHGECRVSVNEDETFSSLETFSELHAHVISSERHERVGNLPRTWRRNFLGGEASGGHIASASNWCVRDESSCYIFHLIPWFYSVATSIISQGFVTEQNYSRLYQEQVRSNTPSAIPPNDRRWRPRLPAPLRCQQATSSVAYSRAFNLYTDAFPSRHLK